MKKPQINSIEYFQEKNVLVRCKNQGEVSATLRLFNFDDFRSAKFPRDVSLQVLEHLSPIKDRIIISFAEFISIFNREVKTEEGVYLFHGNLYFELENGNVKSKFFNVLNYVYNPNVKIYSKKPEIDQKEEYLVPFNLDEFKKEPSRLRFVLNDKPIEVLEYSLNEKSIFICIKKDSSNAIKVDLKTDLDLIALTKKQHKKEEYFMPYYKGIGFASFRGNLNDALESLPKNYNSDYIYKITINEDSTADCVIVHTFEK